MQQGDSERASATPDEAIEAFMAESHREAQAAWALWKKGCLLRELGQDVESDELFQKAMKLRHGLAPNDNRQVGVP
ncbi:hypothetical protein F4818DRAFT_427120 [Hypoxylon cercidicola]|nr:hypothetical protein F4818DRAFT_427120 [Hypoxylon cercidicola]